jgi:threonine dehydrogenase-like Zn-dependent dehydrogenase
LKAVVYAGPGSVRVDEVPVPRLGAGDDIVVSVTATSICGSDLHLLDGKTPGMGEGGVIGHEFLGVVADAGEASGFSPGERVLGSFLIACGECRACVARRFNFCERRRALGLGTLTGDLDGAQAEQVLVPLAPVNARRIPDALEDEQALFGGDILTTGFYAAEIAGVSPGDVAVVFGAGPVGLFTAQAAALRGGRVLVLDADPHRVAFARSLGLEAFDVSEIAAEAEVAGATDGAMADVAIDAVGVVPVVKSALRCVRDGGRIAVVGVYGQERWELPMGVAWVRGIDVRFSGMANVQAHWDATLDAVSMGSIDPTRLITHRLPLERAEEGYELFKSRAAMKVVLQP